MRRLTASSISSVVALTVLIASCAPLVETPQPGTASPSPTPTATPPAATPAPRRTPTPSPTPYVTPTAEPVPTRMLGEQEEEIAISPEGPDAPEPQEIAETEHFTFYGPEGALPAAVADLPERAEAIFDEVSARLGISTEEKTQVTFRPPSSQPCPPRGLAAPRPPRIFIYADDGTSKEQILGVLAHEVGHILIAERFQDVPRALNEGLTTWASARSFTPWLGYPSLDAAVQSHVANGTYLPLHENYHLTDIYPGEEEGTSENCIARRETLYVEWASFLGYLIEQHGMEKLETLIETVPDPERTEEGTVVIPADFEGVYGSSLNQLEAAWLRHIGVEQ